RHLLHDFNIKSFEGGYSSRMVGQQSDAAQSKVRQNLGAQADFALCFTLAFRQRRLSPIVVERDRGLLADSLDRESPRGLMEIDERASSFSGNYLHCAFKGCAAIASCRSEDITDQAMCVHAHQHRLVAIVDFATHQRQMRISAFYLA